MDDATPRPGRTTGLILLAVVFLLGMVCGASLFYMGQRSVRGVGHDRWRPTGGAPREAVGQLVRELDLRPEQVERIREIMGRSREEMHEVLESSRAEIRALLTADQRERFDRMRPLHDRRGKGPPGYRSRRARPGAKRPPPPAGEPPPPPPGAKPPPE
jgi:hypothetical protein